jgi:TIR domain-containing protein
VIREWDFFIAHAAADRSAADELHAVLEQTHGARSFLDYRNLLPGDQWQVELKRALSLSRVTVVLVSAHSDSAYYLQEEVALAIDLVRQGTQAHRIVPVLLRGAEREHLPYGLAKLDALEEGDDGLSGVADELAALLAKLKRRPGTASLARASQLVDIIWSRAGPAYALAAAHMLKQHWMGYTGDGDDIVARHHGREVKRITRAQFERKLKPEQIRYISVLEKSMEVNLALWERTHPNRVLHPEDRERADQAFKAMAEDLAGVLESLEQSGFSLDDHYLDVREVLGKLPR